MTKRLFAMLLVMVMVLSMMPTGVWAENVGEGEGTPAPQAAPTMDGAPAPQPVLLADEPHTHKVCKGTTACADCTHGNVTYQAWGNEDYQKTSLPTSGEYYLTHDVTLSSRARLVDAMNLNLCLNGHKIMVKEGVNDRQFYMANTAKLTLTNCHSQKAGGLTGGNDSAILTAGDSSCQLNLYNIVFEKNKRGSSGGAICLQGACVLNMVGCEFIDNGISSGNGAAIYASGTTVINMEDCNFKDNHADAGHGAAICSDTTGTITLKNCQIKENTAKYSSAMRLNKGTTTLIDTTVEQNHNTTKGVNNYGAIFVQNNAARLVVQGQTRIVNNTNGDNAAYNVYFQHSSGKQGKLAVGAEGLSGNAKIGVYMQSGRLTNDDSFSEALNGKSYAKYFEANNAGYQIFTEDDRLVMIQSTGDVHIHKLCNDPDCEEHETMRFKPWGNTDEERKSLPSSGNYYLTNDVQLTAVKNFTTAGTLNLCLNGKKIIAKQSATSPDRHFAISTTGVVLSVTDCETDPEKVGQITGGRRTFGGGAVSVNAGSTFNLFGGNITDNHAIKNTGGTAIGGAVFLYGNDGSTPGGVFNMYGGKLTGNTSEAEGGAIYGRAGSTVNIYGGEISGNEAATQGGAIYFVGSKLTAQNCKINGNKASSAAAIRSGSNAVLELTNCEVKDNETTGIASAIRLEGTAATLKLVDTVIEGNKSTGTAANDSYGAVYAPNGAYQLIVEGKTRITNNLDKNGDPSNIYFLNRSPQFVVSVGANGLSDNAEIGIAMWDDRLAAGGNMITAQSVAEGQETFFKSNMSDYAVVRNGNDGKLYLQDKNHASHNVCCDASCPDSHENLIWLPWNDAKALPSKGNYYLNTDVTLSGVRVLNTGDLNLCLHGHKVTIDKNERMLAVGQADDNAKVCVTASITDCTGNGQLTGGVRNYGGAISVNPGSTLNLYGGNIVDNKTLAETGDAAKAGAIFLTQARDGLPGAIFNMYGGTISGNKAYYGGAVFVGAEAQANMYGGTISGNEAYRGGAIYAEKNGIINIAGGEIKENTASNRGSAILLSGGVLNLSGGEISKNTAKSAIVATSSAVITMTGGKIVENNGSAGGAIILESAGTKMTMSGGEITGNTASAGAGVYVSTNTTFEMTGGVICGNTSTSTGGGLHLLRSNVTLTGGEIKDNVSKSSGGGVQIEGAKITVTGAKITGNQAVNGAGMYIAGAKSGDVVYQPAVTLEGGEISGNTASGVGGGVTTKDADFEKLELSGNLVITGNRAGNKTSNLYLPGKAVFTVGAMGENAKVGISAARVYGSMSQKTDTDCTAAFVSDNSALKVIYKDSTVYLQPADGHTHCVCLDQNPNCKHEATQFAAWSDPTKLPSTPGNYYLTVDVKLGAVCNVFEDINLCLNGHTITPKTNERTFAVNPGVTLSVTDCTDKGVITGGVRNYGGVINVNQGATFNLYGGNLTGNRTVKMNGEAGKAGAVYLTKATEGQPGGVFNMYGGSITENKTFWGGAVYVCDGAVMNLYGGIIANNEAMDRAGAICGDGKAVINLYGGTITGNTAAKGGAIYVRNGSHINMAGGLITKNKTNATVWEEKQISKGSGGAAIALTNQSTMTMTGGEISYNESMAAGGAIIMESQDTKMTMTGGKIVNNTTPSDGAGIYVSRNTVFEMSGGEIKNNSAKGNGGGMYILQSTVTISGGSVSSNVSRTKSGGGIGMGRGVLNLKGGTIGYNRTQDKAGKGAGIMMNGATLNIYGGQIVGNTLHEDASGGAAICTSTASETKNGVKTTFYTKINMYGGTISNHVGRNGGAMLLQSQTVFNLYGGTIRDNEATINGGAADLYSKSIFNMYGGSVINNKAESRGGGIHFTAATGGEFTGGTATGNFAGEYGGFINCHGIDAKITVKDMKIYGNESRNYGGAIAVTWNAILDMDDCEFYENIGGEGGAMYLAHKTTCDLDNVKVYKNFSNDAGGAFYLDVGNNINFTNVKILENEAVANGGAIYTRANLHLKDCVIDGNVSGKDGGAIATSAAWTYGNLPENTNGYVGRGQGMIIENCKITNNTCVGRGGGAFMAKKNWNTVIDSEFSGNVSGETGSALFVGDDLVIKGMTVTGNTSKTDGYAVYFRENAYDGQSYMQAIHAMGGNVIVKDNQGGDMYLCEKIAIGNTAEGYGQDTYFNVTLSDGVLTNRLFGEYNYEGGDQVYTVTYGSRSYTDPEVDTARVNANNEKIASGDIWLYVGLGAFVAVVAAVVILIVAKKKKAGKPAETTQE